MKLVQCFLLSLWTATSTRLFPSWLIALFFTLSSAMGTAFGASWYVDGKAAGSNNGTNWANAWVNPTNIVWASVNPGDTIFVSGGTTNQIYTNDLAIPKNGTPGNYITVRIGQETGHNGVAIFDGCKLTMNNYSQWVAIDGGRFPSFVAPTNHQQVITGSTAITNNIGFWIRNVTDTNYNDRDVQPVLWYFTSPNNLRFSYIEVSGLTNNSGYTDTNSDFRTADAGVVCAGRINGGTPTNITFQYLYLHDNAGRSFQWNNEVALDFDEVVFKFGWLNLNCEDHFQIDGGWTVRDSVVGPVNGVSSHTDLFQTQGNFIKIYNNDIRESQNSIMRIQTYPDPPSQGLRHDVWFFNNLVTEKLGRARMGGTRAEPFCMVHVDTAHPCEYTTYSNIVFANNLFYNSVSNTWNWIFYGNSACVNPVMYWARGNMVTNSIIKHCLFVNNLVIDKEKGIGFPLVTNLAPASGYLPFTTNDFVVNYNTFAATNTALDWPLRVYYLDTITNAGLGPYVFKNTTNYPAFVDKENDNFELQSTDMAALNTGMNLSSYFNFDSLNRPRNVGGAWDRGPLEYQGSGSTSGPTNGLLVWLTFNDDFYDSKLDDASGNGNNAYRFGRIGSVYPTNFPTRILSSTTPGRTNLFSSDYCGRFGWWTNSVPLTAYNIYSREGTYAGITNVANLTNMATASIMCWARYYAPEPGYPDWTTDGNASLLSAGTSTGVPGTWDFGRYNGQGSWENNTRFCVLTNSLNYYDSILEFPENGLQDDTTNWTHYAVTWNNGVMIGYMNGVAFQTNDVSALVTRLQIGANNNNPTPWIGIGVNTHGGTPPLYDEETQSPPQIDYPNNGYMNGVIDDVRIYNRALTAAEVQQVYSGSSSSDESATSPIILTGAAKLPNGAFQFAFTNTPSGTNTITTNITTTIITNWNKTIITGYTTNITTTFTTNTSEDTATVLTTTNLLLPLTNWTVLGTVTDNPPGQFQFSDPQATNRPLRFYRVRSP